MAIDCHVSTFFCETLKNVVEPAYDVPMKLQLVMVHGFFKTL